MTAPFSPFDTIWIARNAVVGWFGITTNFAQVAVVVTPTVTATMIATRKGAVSLTVTPTITATMTASFKDTLSLTVTPTISVSANVIKAIYGARTTVDIPNPYVGPMALRHNTRMPYYRTGGIVGPPVFDAVGPGALNIATSLSWTHTPVLGGQVLVPVVISGTANTITVITYGGTNMTLVSSIPLNNSTANGTLYLYGLAGVSSAAQTVSVTFSATSTARGNSVTYTNVVSLGTPTTVFGNSTSLSQGPITCPTGQMLFQVFGAESAAFTADSGGTSRYNPASGAVGLDIQDSTSTATFGATEASAENYGGINVVLV